MRYPVRDLTADDMNKETWWLSKGGYLKNVHPEALCVGRYCVLHNPSEHHMRDWPLNWRQCDTFIDMKDSHFERICPCGVGHPDPDDLEYHLSLGRDYMAIHGCCGCCGR